MSQTNEYTEELRRVRSLLIVTSLQKRTDLKATQLIASFSGKLDWQPLDLLIDPEVWSYAVDEQGYDPKLVFCHPDVLAHNPMTALYYRGLCGLSIKAARDSLGDVKPLEDGTNRAPLTTERALAIARTYNAFICSIVGNSTGWTLENGARTIIATLGITLDGVMRNKIGAIAEQRIRSLLLRWLMDKGLLVSPNITPEELEDNPPQECVLSKSTTMRFSSEPDVSFLQNGVLVAVIEIKGGIDPAGALERYGAATKSFQQAVRESPRCKNFYLAAAFTPELENRILDDRLVERTFDIVDVLEKPSARDQLFDEVFRYTLRLF